MPLIDWRDLYARNQAAIAASGVGLPAMTAPSMPAVGISQAPEPPVGPLAELVRGAGPLVSPRRRPPTVRSTGRRETRTDARSLVHVPTGLDPAVPAPVVCMLHGCTQDPVSFATGTAMNETADRHGFVVVYPAQPRGANANRCWNWFSPAHQHRGAGEPELIAATARRLIAEQPGQMIDPTRVFIAGLSSGGAMALILAACYPEVFAAVAIHSGLPYRSANTVASAFAAMGDSGATTTISDHAIHEAMGTHARPIPSLVIHGTADRTVAPANSRRILAQSMHANHLAASQRCTHDPASPTNSQNTRVPGGLDYTRSQWLDSDGRLMHEFIEVHHLGHAWSGGVAGGAYTDPRGPSATQAIWTFFDQATRAPKPAAMRQRGSIDPAIDLRDA